MPFHPSHNSRLLAASLLALLLSSYLFAAEAHGDESRDISKVNGGIRVSAKEVVGEVSSVNGGIDIGRGASALRVETVNSGIEIEDEARVASAETVNGGIRIGENVTIEGAVETVNGGVRVDAGSSIGGGIETTNGRITLDAVRVSEDIVTTNGDINLQGESEVGADVIFEGRRSMWTRWLNWSRRTPELTIDSTVVIHGNIRLYQEVELEIADGASYGEIVRHYRD